MACDDNAFCRENLYDMVVLYYIVFYPNYSLGSSLSCRVGG